MSGPRGITEITIVKNLGALLLGVLELSTAAP